MSALPIEPPCFASTIRPAPHLDGEFDPAAVKAVLQGVGKVARKWFRYQASGLDRVPDEPTLLVGNHSGGKLPLDMMMFAEDWYRAFGYQRPLFALGHDLLFKVPPVGRRLRQIGAVPARPEHADALLAAGHSVLVMPGGDWETFRPWSDRYKVDFRNRRGFVKTALRRGVPITPVVTAGSHEMFVILTRGERIARAVGLNRLRVYTFPISLGFPFGLYVGPVPSPLPFPARIETEVLEPVRLDGLRPEAADDPEVVHRIYTEVMARMQAGMDRLSANRRPLFG
ncbi:MAG: 1-acyl-sn-glycerol-3-phosphate acyltransferase [Myxococcota bacterium]|jgi:1-acyl-sn-glycerol-3-phosphate acyltransferase